MSRRSMLAALDAPTPPVQVIIVSSYRASAATWREPRST
jgi:hypothetical protein